MGKKFIMLGERGKNGRIAKNEGFSLEEFRNKLPYAHGYHYKQEPIRIIERLFSKKMRERIRESFIGGYSNALEDLMKDINTEINNDSFGRKKRK